MIYIVMPIVIFSASWAIFFPVMRYVMMPNDEGFLMHPAERIYSKEVPYRDFDTTYPPGRAYLLALTFKLLGISWLSAKIWFLASFSILMTLLYFVSIAITDNLFFSILPFITIVCYLFPDSEYNPPMYVNFSMNAAKLIPPVIIIIFFIQYCNSANPFFLAAMGFFIGFSFISGQETALCITAAVIASIIFKGDNIVREMGYILSGSFFFILSFYSYIKKAKIPLKNIWECSFKNMFTYIKYTRLPYPRLNFLRLFKHLNWPSFESISMAGLSKDIYVSRFYLPWLVYCALGVMLITKKIYGNLSHTDMIVFQILMFGATFLLYVIQRSDYFHLVVSLLPFYMLYSYVLSLLFEKLNYLYDKDMFGFAFFGTVYLAIAAAILFLHDISTFLKSYIYHIKEKRNKIFLPVKRGLVYIEKEKGDSIAAIIEYMAKNTSEGDYIFVLPSEPQLYFLIERKNPTRVLSILPHILKKDEKGIINDLQDKRPEYVIYNKDEVEHSYQNNEHLKRYAPNLYNYIWKQYQVKDEFSPYFILRRIP